MRLRKPESGDSRVRDARIVFRRKSLSAAGRAASDDPVKLSHPDGMMRHMTRAPLRRATFQRCDLPLRDWTSTEVDPAVVVVRLLRANARLVTDLNQRFEEARVPTFDVARLLWLWEERGTSSRITDVARNLGLSESAASRLVVRAERLGLVDRFRDELDGRETSVRVTTLGRAAIHRLDAVLRAAAQDVQCDAAVAEWLTKRCGPGD
jgi:DNA-binding MarR family transcriptional regulator